MPNTIKYKQELIQQLRQRVAESLERAVRASADARSGATHEDAVAKSKYETQATELSYLADGQAKRAQALRGDLHYLNQLEVRNFADDDPVDLTALVKVSRNGRPRWYLILDHAAGITITHEGTEVMTLSPKSPLGDQLVGLYVGDEVGDTPDSEITEIR